MTVREDAARAAASLRAALADPSLMGAPVITHVLLGNPRRGIWLQNWPGVPGLHQSNRAFTHALLPGWEYTSAEMRTEMLDDLDRLAATGETPKVATR